MALQGPIPVEFAQVFPRGVFAAGPFEPVRDFDASKGDRFVQSKDKATGPAAVGRRGDRRRPGGAGEVAAGQGRGGRPAGAACAASGDAVRPGGVRRADGDPVCEPGRAAGLLAQGGRSAVASPGRWRPRCRGGGEGRQRHERRKRRLVRQREHARRAGPDSWALCHTYGGTSLPSLYVHAGRAQHDGVPVRRHDHRRSCALLAPSWPRRPRHSPPSARGCTTHAQADSAGTNGGVTARVGRQERPFLPPRYLPRSANRREVSILVRDFTGEQIAQVDNADPFAAPVWRSPVHRTPEWVIWLVQLIRLLVRVIWFLIRHPLLDAAAGLVILTWAKAGWPGVVVLANVTVASLVTLRLWRPDWYARLVTVPLRCRWRWLVYRRRWQAVMTIAGLAPTYRGRVTLPVLGKVQAGTCADLVTRPAGVRAVAAGFRRPGRASWRTGFGSAPAASAPPGPGWSCWNWSAGTRWPR